MLGIAWDGPRALFRGFSQRYLQPRVPVLFVRFIGPVVRSLSLGLPYNRDVFAGMDYGLIDRRKSERFGVHLSLRYRRSEKRVDRLWSKGITSDMSCDGVAFKGSDALPVGSHVELWIDWPVRQAAHLIDLHATGFVVWSGSGETAVRITSYRFRVNSAEVNHTDRPAR